jgi:hypothetical protein
MRFTFVILLFCGFGADAQMIIKAHANYRPYAVAVAQNLLLDDYPNAAAAYSLRKLDKDYTGSAIRVRRSNDNSEQDIGFTSSGDLDTASLKTFVGANSGAVTTWYDQSGNARNATQATAANQPRVVNAGVVERQNGKVSIRLDGTNDGLATSSDITYTTNDQYITIINTPSSTITESTSPQALISGGNNNPNTYNNTITGYGSISTTLTNERLWWLQIRPATDPATSLVLGYGQTSTNISGSQLHTFQWYSSTISIHQNGVNQTLSTVSTGGFANSSLNRPTIFRAIGYRFATNSLYFNGAIQEIIIYGSNQSSNRSGIETNINSYYGIY